MPPRWSPLKKARKLPEDNGEYFRDANAARYPEYPVEPGIRALIAMDPSFDLGALDVVACGSTLGNLLRFSRSIEHDFRFEVDMIEGTLFLIRKENSPTQLIEDVLGYGHTFPEAYTTWDKDVRGSISHQRLITYSIGGLSFLLRSESDGYNEDLGKPVEAPFMKTAKANVTRQEERKEASPGHLSSAQTTEVISQVTNSVESFSIGQAMTQPTSRRLIVELGGSLVPQNSVFDLKTRSVRKEIKMEDMLPRLWANQSPNLVMAYHKDGLFEDIRMEDVRSQIDQWQSENQEAIERLVVILQQIMSIMRSSENKRLEVVRADKGTLEIRERVGEGAAALPPDLVSRWQSLWQSDWRLG